MGKQPSESFPVCLCGLAGISAQHLMGLFFTDFYFFSVSRFLSLFHTGVELPMVDFVVPEGKRGSDRQGQGNSSSPGGIGVQEWKGSAAPAPSPGNAHIPKSSRRVWTSPPRSGWDLGVSAGPGVGFDDPCGSIPTLDTQNCILQLVTPPGVTTTRAGSCSWRVLLTWEDPKAPGKAWIHLLLILPQQSWAWGAHPTRGSHLGSRSQHDPMCWDHVCPVLECHQHGGTSCLSLGSIGGPASAGIPSP